MASDGADGPGGRRLALFSWGRYGEYFARPELGSLLWQFFAFAFAFASFTSGFALFAERQLSWHGVPFGPKHVGYIFAYAGLLGIFLQGGLIGRLVKRFGEAKLSRAGFLSMGSSNTRATVRRLIRSSRAIARAVRVPSLRCRMRLPRMAL